ncbi:MAG: glutamate--tRNA ligase [Helicobacter sp.]|nr:glutamate--tRNA ligase [Helicobacter sp.]
MLRFAPSPTGDMHIGNLRAAIFNYILAKQRNEEFLLRIEDTDVERNIEGKDKEILQILTLFGILWDKLVYQSENLRYHQTIADHLQKSGKAFLCYCTEGFLDKKREEAKEAKRAFRYDDSWSELEKETNQTPVVRLHGAKADVCYTDKIKGALTFGAGEVDSFVILRANGLPTYNFACAVDDVLYDISFIVRGEDHTTNTPKQILIREAMQCSAPIDFAHLPIILNEEGKKMSKREQSSSVKWLLEEGFLPQAIANYLISMGNNTPVEVFTLKESIAWFDIAKITKSPVKFDIKRLRFLNREHFKRLSDSELAYLLESSSPQVGALARFYLQESSTLNELRNAIEPIFSAKDPNAFPEFADEIRQLHGHIIAMLDSLHPALSTFESFKKELMAQSNLKGKHFFKPLRILLTGKSDGPELSDLYPLIWGMLKDIARIKEATC